MTIEGIWTGEVYGPFGWENRGVFIFEDGRIMGGDNRQYTAGTYSVSGDTVVADMEVHYYGPPRAQFGEVLEQFRTKFEGTLSEGAMDGVISRPDRPQFDLQARLTRRIDLPHR